MKRRSFLSLLGLAPAASLIAKEMAKAATPVVSYDAPLCQDHPPGAGCHRCETCHEWHCSLGPHAHIRHVWDTTPGATVVLSPEWRAR